MPLSLHQRIFWAYQPTIVLPVIPMPAVEQAASSQIVAPTVELCRCCKPLTSTALSNGRHNLQGRSKRMRKSPKHLTECFVFDNPTSPPVHGTEAQTTDPSCGSATHQDRC